MIDFKGYTQKAIQTQLLGRVSDKIDRRQGSIIQTALGPVAWYLEGLYMLLSQVQENAYAGTAVGEYLDYVCAERNIVRKAPTPAVRQGTFNVEIPEGSLFKTINGAASVIFRSGGLISSEKDRYVYEMTCSVPGTIGNSYTGNMLPITAISGLTSAELGEIKTPGSDEENDDSLRARFFESFDVASFGGNIAAYRNTILAIEGVGAVQVYPAWKGGGTVLCSILDSELTPAESGLVAQVQKAICPPEQGGSEPSGNGYGMAPIGAAVTITTATNLTLNISVSIQLAATVRIGAEAYQEQIEQKIQAYLLSVCRTWWNAIKGQKIEYVVGVYACRIVAAILEITDIVNVTDVLINGSPGDLTLTETAQLQQIPSLGEVTVREN